LKKFRRYRILQIFCLPLFWSLHLFF